MHDQYTPPPATRRSLVLRVITHPVIGGQIAFVTVVTAVTLFALGPVGEGIGLAIATHENSTLVATLVAGVLILGTMIATGLTMMALQAFGRPRHRSNG